MMKTDANMLIMTYANWKFMVCILKFSRIFFYWLNFHLSLLYIGNYIKGKENYSKSERYLNPLYSFSIFFFKMLFMFVTVKHT